MARILESKESPAIVVVTHHIDVNLSSNYVKLNFLFMVVEIRAIYIFLKKGVTGVHSVFCWDIRCGKDSDIILAQVPL
jgi:hypothetical protein